MTNTFSPFGFQVLRRREGGQPTMGLEKVSIASTDATPIFYGDPVQDGAQTVASAQFGNYVTQGTSSINTGQICRGIFRGCEYYSAAIGRMVWQNWYPGSGVTGLTSGPDPIAYIEADDQLYFIAQCNTTAIVNSSQVNYNINITASATSGNTTTGLSAVALQSSSVATSASLAFRIIDFLSNYSPPGGVVNGTDNTTAGQVLVVAPNNWDTKNTTGST